MGYNAPDRGISARARIEKPTEQGLQARVRIEATGERTILVRARISNFTSYGLQARGRVIVPIEKTISGRARINQPSEKSISARARILERISEAVLRGTFEVGTSGQEAVLRGFYFVNLLGARFFKKALSARARIIGFSGDASGGTGAVLTGYFSVKQTGSMSDAEISGTLRVERSAQCRARIIH